MRIDGEKHLQYYEWKMRSLAMNQNSFDLFFRAFLHFRTLRMSHVTWGNFHFQKLSKFSIQFSLKSVLKILSKRKERRKYFGKRKKILRRDDDDDDGLP